jgi:exosortase A-associated hydrolase 1
VSTPSEEAMVFRCGADQLVGIAHHAPRPAQVGVLVVVGGPQYRVGSHRQFVLMARRIAAAGYPVLRFDYRGMGDSDGATRTFEAIDADIRAAIDALLERQPQMRGVVLLGLCDAASAALMYCSQDARVAGLVLLNPWVRTEAGEAHAVVHHYYWQRLLEGSLWAKLLSGKFDLRASIRDFMALLRRSRHSGESGRAAGPAFLERMAQGIRAFHKPVLLLLSGRDLTAREFEDYCASSPAWRDWLSSGPLTTVRLAAADHTLSSAAPLAAASASTVQWLETVGAGALRERAPGQARYT